jgi:hypothetical protein
LEPIQEAWPDDTLVESSEQAEPDKTMEIWLMLPWLINLIFKESIF